MCLVNLRYTAELRLEKISAMAWMLLSDASLGEKGKPSTIAKLRFQKVQLLTSALEIS